MDYAYTCHTHHASQVRKVLVCFVAAAFGHAEYTHFIAEHCSKSGEILRDLVLHYQKAITEGTAGRSFADFDAKEFHVQEEDEDDEDLDEIDFDDLIAIGPPDWIFDEEYSYNVPRNLICARSRCVAVHNKGNPASTFRTGEEHNPKSFQTYIQLLYSDHLVLTEDDSALCFGEFLEELRYLYDLIVETKDYVSINLITDTLLGYLRTRGEVDFDDLAKELGNAYEVCGEKSPWREVLLRFAVCQMGNEEFRKDILKRSEAREIAMDMLKYHFQAIVAGGGGFESCEAREFCIGEGYWDKGVEGLGDNVGSGLRITGLVRNVSL
ncbi:hypothetical protein EJ03DRAFT_355052 [Teratosphaeria nubilosa]|uniref:BTB domain-containing protein n=1 Tax=Teratosphaeria nubilosa TaxID=161662 RepID=A0A6G1KYB5_9PEZI|nr:hypothetical protein EJ03DRAFT_355052 [Teratosphaeria nubilosa]